MKLQSIGSLLSLVLLSGCTAVGNLNQGSSLANQDAEALTYQPVEYKNLSKKGPTLIVIPGQIKSNNATFRSRYAPNNIADFGETELLQANFKVLERANLGPVFDEIALAANTGNANKVRNVLRGGNLKTTQWFVKFDIIKAEKVADAGTSFDPRVLSSLLLGGTSAAQAAGSVKTEQDTGVWWLGMRYKVINARTTEQVTGGYFEEKMEVGKKATCVLGFCQGQTIPITLDTMIQRLIQKAVVDMDAKK